MDALTFLNTYGWGRAEAVAKRAGTNRAYFSQIAYGHRRPSYDLAQALAAASDGEMDVGALMGGRQITKPKAAAQRRAA